MGTYYFTNRRRAKDAIMTILDIHGSNDLMVFVRDSVVYVDFKNSTELPADISAILHYAVQATESIEKLLQLDEISEVYRDEGLIKFRV